MKLISILEECLRAVKFRENLIIQCGRVRNTYENDDETVKKVFDTYVALQNLVCELELINPIKVQELSSEQIINLISNRMNK